MKLQMGVKRMLNTLRIICLVLAIGLMFVWAVYLGSGHKIPTKTNLSFLRAMMIVIILIGLLSLIINKRNKKY
jgi:hypothetical protein